MPRLLRKRTVDRGIVEKMVDSTETRHGRLACLMKNSDIENDQNSL